MKPRSGNKYKVIGVMSGTSLDGLDLAAVELTFKNNKWNFKLAATATVPYSDEWENKLAASDELTGEKLIQLHTDYGRFTGKEVMKFMQSSKFVPDLIASHGHTVFHQPEKHFTFQAGNGADIATETGITTVADFRTGDVALGGQGAPLVPVGDRQLFSEYDSCLNLGGFANISFEKSNKRIAFDICPVNFILNYLTKKEGLPYDKNGELGKTGKTDSKLFHQLNQLPFYGQTPPKSLGKEWMDHNFFPLVENSPVSIPDKLRTVYEHIAVQIGKTIPDNGKVLVTGGGAFNSFLIEQLKTHSSAEIIIPEKQIIDFKEALIFAFLGLLGYLGQNNCLASVTGAKRDSSAGMVFPGV